MKAIMWVLLVASGLWFFLGSYAISSEPRDWLLAVLAYGTSVISYALFVDLHNQDLNEKMRPFSVSE